MKSQKPPRGPTSRAGGGHHHAAPMSKGLPSSPSAEKEVLGVVLLKGERILEVWLEPEDFFCERYRSTFRCMLALRDRGEHINLNSVYEEMRRQGDAQSDTLSFLGSLTDGMPLFPSLDSQQRILRRKTAARRGMALGTKLVEACSLEMDLLTDILGAHAPDLEALRTMAEGDTKSIRRIEDLESIFMNRKPLEFVIRPELPVKSIVTLTGDSESGKTTLACAWARDALENGHAVLLLDRDKNPRDRICDRLQRLGLKPDGRLFWVWDCEQEREPPQPNDPIILDWVKRMIEETGKSPVVIVDSLISFFLPEEDENDAVDMRKLFDRCRAINNEGGTVIPIHHTNRQGEARGSSDFRPASDQAFLVKNVDRSGGRLLDVISLECQKSRYGFSGRIEYHYAGGKMLRQQDQPTAGKSNTELLEALLKRHPGVSSEEFEMLASEQALGRNRARDFLTRGLENGNIEIEYEGRKHCHFWCGPTADRAKSEEQENSS